MKKAYCDICGKEIKKLPTIDILNKGVFTDMDDEPIDDVCKECYGVIYCCINMMKEANWRPDFHEVLESNNAWTREKAGYKLCDLEDKTGLEF